MHFHHSFDFCWYFLPTNRDGLTLRVYLDVSVDFFDTSSWARQYNWIFCLNYCTVWLEDFCIDCSWGTQMTPNPDFKTIPEVATFQNVPFLVFYRPVSFVLAFNSGVMVYRYVKRYIDPMMSEFFKRIMTMNTSSTLLEYPKLWRHPLKFKINLCL